MATITNTQVTTALADYVNWFGPHGSVTGVTNGVTEDDEDFTFETVNETEVEMTYLELVDPVVAKQIIIAAEIDAIAAAVTSGGFGPLERITAITDLPFSDRNRPRIHLKTVNNEDVSLKYDELASAAARGDVVTYAEGWTGKVASLKTRIAAIYAKSNAMTAPHTFADYKDLISDLVDIPETKAQI